MRATSPVRILAIMGDSPSYSPTLAQAKGRPEGRPFGESMVRSALERVAGCFLKLAGTLLDGTFDLVGSSIGPQLLVAGRLADRILDVATSLFGGAFDFVLMRH